MVVTVLVVDDSMMVRRQVGRALEDAGFAVLEAADGQEALDKMAAAAVGLVVCDVNMPRMDGLEFLERLGPAGVAATPVVMLTTEGQPALVQRAKAAGANGWIVKPFKAELLVATIRKLAKA